MCVRVRVWLSLILKKKDLITKVSYACWLRISSVCFFLWFDEISFFRGWRTSHRQSITRKRMFACSIHFHGGWLRKSNVKSRKTVLTLLIEFERVKVYFLEVTLERVCWASKWKCEKIERVLKDERIYKKFLSWNRLQKRGTKLKCGICFEHWPRGFPGQWATETEYLRASAIFVSGTSGKHPF